MPLSKEQLMMPRYKVVADYPNSSYSVGNILPECFQDWDENTDDDFIETEMGVVAKYPHLFQPLPWWADRDEKDMPEYIRFYEPLPTKYSIWKINEWRFGFKRPLVKTDCDIVWRELSIADEPATLTEYNQFINQKEK